MNFNTGEINLVTPIQCPIPEAKIYRVTIPANTTSYVQWTDCEGIPSPKQLIYDRMRSIDFVAINTSPYALVSASSAATITEVGTCFPYPDCICSYTALPSTTTTTVAPVNFTLTPYCTGSGVNGTGTINVNTFTGGNGTYQSIAIGTTAGNAFAATPINLSGASSYEFTGLFNGTYHIILRDGLGVYTIKNTNVNCINVTSTTSTTSTTTSTTSTSTTTSTTTAAPICTYNGGSAVITYTTTTTSTSTSTTTTEAPTTTTTSTSTTTTTEAPTYNSFSLAYSSTSGAEACSRYPTLFTNTYYTNPAISVLADGVTIYQDTNLTNAAGNGYYSNGTNYWNTGAGAGNLQNQTSCSGTTTTTTTTTAAPSATLQWDFTESGGANGSMDLFVNASVIESRVNTSNGTYTVYVGDTINVQVTCDTCGSPDVCSTAESQSNKSILDASETVNSGPASIFTSVYTVVSGDIGNNINLSTFAICNTTCL
jgi:hypothetical protein